MVCERLCVTKWCERLCVKDGESSAISVTPATQSDGRCHQVPVDKLCVSKLCGDKLCVSKLCVSKLCGQVVW